MSIKLIKYLRHLLWPFAIIWYWVTETRTKKLIDKWQQLKPNPCKVVCVGNLSAGGSGKTPLVIYLAQNYPNPKNLAILSRGYGRKTDGFLQLNRQSTADQVGDEPLLIYKKLNYQINVFVSGNRSLAISKIVSLYPNTQVILLDDGYQHRKVKADKYILVTPATLPFWNDYLLPVGYLRETPKYAQLASAVVLSKTNNLNTLQIEALAKKASAYLLHNTPVFATAINYGKLYNYLENKTENLELGEKIFAFCGISNPKSFINQLSCNYSVVGSMAFADHHRFTKNDIEQIIIKAKKLNAHYLVTTEKDAVKLNFIFENKDFKLPFVLLVQPIELNIVYGQANALHL